MNRLKYFSTGIILFIFFSVCLSTENTRHPYFEKAERLIAEGVEHSQEIIDLLNKELASYPDHIGSLSLLGVTYFGLEEYQEADNYLDKALTVINRTGYANPDLYFLKAQTEYYTEQYFKSFNTLKQIADFFNETEENQKRYADFAEKISIALKMMFADYSALILSEMEDFDLKGFHFTFIDFSLKSTIYTDRNIGPFINLSFLEANCNYVLVTLSSKHAGFCVYFNDDVPVGYSKISAQEKAFSKSYNETMKIIEQNYITVSNYASASLHKRDEKSFWKAGHINLENGKSLVTLKKE